MGKVCGRHCFGKNCKASATAATSSAEEVEVCELSIDVRRVCFSAKSLEISKQHPHQAIPSRRLSSMVFPMYTLSRPSSRAAGFNPSD